MVTTALATASWLGLLADDAPESAYDELQRALLAAAANDERPAVEADVAAALRLRAQLHDHRRRVAELAALNDLGVRLTAMRDVDALLQEVVTQARRLLDVDVAYLALAEPNRALTIRVTDGSLGPHLRGVRMAPYSGLAGRVLDCGEPVSTSDYLADPALAHDERLDAVAADEGLRTITGVPLRLHHEVIGVLMTAQRAVLPPTPNDLSLLSSLAALAAVAIENAQLFSERDAAMAALAAANEELRRAAESVSRAVVLHEKLMEVALRGGGVGQVLASVSEVVGGLVVLVDPDGAPLAAAAEGAVLSTADAPVSESAPTVSATFANPESRRTVVSDTTIAVPVTSGDRYYGALYVHNTADVDEGVLRLLERSAMTLALIEAVAQQVADAERRSVDDFLEQMVSNGLPPGDVARRQALAIGLDLHRPHLVLVARPGKEQVDEVRRWGERLVAVHGGIVGAIGGAVVIVAGADANAESLRTARSPNTPVGFAGPVEGISELAAAYDDALACVHALHALGDANRVACADDLGPFRFLLSTNGRGDAQRFVRHQLGTLLDYDARRGTDLVETARHYLGNGQRHADTARALGIHSNTLYQRLARLDKVLGPGWLSEARALDIQLALRIHRLFRDQPWCEYAPPT